MLQPFFTTAKIGKNGVWHVITLLIIPTYIQRVVGERNRISVLAMGWTKLAGGMMMRVKKHLQTHPKYSLASLGFSISIY